MTMIPILQTPLGRLYEADCSKLLASLESETVDLAFADPPFNLGKAYSSKINDDLASHEYLDWCEAWLAEMVRVLKPGGALMLWNLPKWNLPLGGFLSRHLTFRHWIAVDIKYALPVKGRLYPSHYSLLYFVKGARPAIFHPDRIPIACCRHCGGELKDYGGYKDKMNPKGVNIADVWTDISPVRHSKYKKREANALPLKLMDRIISMSTDPGSLVLDPFGGSGTTFAAAELTGRRWVGSELDCATIVQRFDELDDDREHLAQIHATKNTLFTQADLRKRAKSGKPLSKSYQVTLEEEAESCSCSSLAPVQSQIF
ncbi:site-specific DNA-methyltransferase [Rhodanobacter sp. AS-Z3]|uniref:DNA-methyltransferase n=1 Tax=Rhodanobacter sp. AS-Z3 TaxID=3031330 RepID=UPI0024797EAA|nr:site-specific DNA-methyltransferase [Rhodanobacter sp. AS-Z3]WEN14648.1 site-specific DNA-methyltransferase [Rhodanobacter sp. AS-Z3]